MRLGILSPTPWQNGNLRGNLWLNVFVCCPLNIFACCAYCIKKSTDVTKKENTLYIVLMVIR